MIEITYLFHSGFYVELEKSILIFDYFRDNCKKNRYEDCGQIKKEDLPDNKNVYIFVSHGHYDHYDKEILTFNKENVSYIFSKDIKPLGDFDNITYMGKDEEINIKDIRVKSFGSTDEGISFLVSVENTNIFHAGDLNWWHWEGENDKEKEDAKNNYFKEVEKLKDSSIDVAFFPVDPRLENAYYYGGEYFINEISPKIFIPMHFQDVYEITERFAEKMKDSKSEVLRIRTRGESLYKK